MDKRRRKKLQSHKRGLALVDEHRTFLTSTPGGAAIVAALDQAVADESTAIVDQESHASEERSASALLRTLRRALRDGVKHIAAVSAVVMPAGGTGAPFDSSRPPNDDQLIGRVAFLHAAVSADLEAYTKFGIQPGRLDALAGEVAAFKKAKAALTSKQHAEAGDRFDQAFERANQAFAILEGILATSPDAPAGALDALRATTRIGPRIRPDDSTPEAPGEGTTTTPAPAAPVTSLTGAETTHTPAVTTTPPDRQEAA